MATYRFGRELGGGGYGVVKEAVRVDDNWACAAKILQKAQDAEAVARFRKEVRLQSQLRHRNIVPIMGMNLSNPRPWYVMPRAKSSLSDLIQNGHGEDLLWAFLDAARGVEFAHENGVIHRDLKPDNILVFNDRRGDYAAVADFGMGRHLNSTSTPLTRTNDGFGTPDYVAPEQWRDAKRASFPADVYALGKILYQVLTGLRPYPKVDFMLVPKRYLYIVRRSTNDNPADRYPTAAAMLKDVALVSERQHEFERPLESARRCIQESDAGELIKVLCEHRNDYQLLQDLIPDMPKEMLALLVQDHLEEFRLIVEAYDTEVAAGRLTFQYCDTVANFYERMFRATDDFELRRRVLARLLMLGPANNRWHVGEVFARLVGSLHDESLVMVLRDLFQNYPREADWHRPYLATTSIPPLLRKVL